MAVGVGLKRNDQTIVFYFLPKIVTVLSTIGSDVYSTINLEFANKASHVIGLC